MGYLLAGDYEPGLFDLATEQAVRQFQSCAGILTDGVVGEVTLSRIEEKPPCEATSASIYSEKNSLGFTSNSVLDSESTLDVTDINSTDSELHQQGTTSPEIQEILDRDRLTVSVLGRDNPPFFMVDETARLYGADIEIAKGIASNLGVELEILRSASTFDEVVKNVYEHRADLAISKISRTLSQAKRTRFSTPYISLRQGLLVNRLQLAQQTNGDTITQTIRNLDGRVGVIEGSSYERFAKEKFPSATIFLTYKTWPEVVEAVTKGDVLAAYRDELEVKKIVLSKPNSALNFQTISITDAEDAIAVVLPWNSNHLLSFVNQYIETTGEHYTTDTLLGKYADYFAQS